MKKYVEQNYIVKATRRRDGKVITLTREEWFQIKWEKFTKLYYPYEIIHSTEK